MQTKPIKRPWERQGHGIRYNPDSFYQSTIWKRTRAAFIQSTTTLPDGRVVPNDICIQCYIEQGKATPVHTVDHIKQKREGGDATSFSNLQSLCSHHHAIKSANEGNQKRKK